MKSRSKGEKRRGMEREGGKREGGKGSSAQATQTSKCRNSVIGSNVTLRSPVMLRLCNLPATSE